MVILVNPSYCYFRKYNSDIWGLFSLKSTLNMLYVFYYSYLESRSNYYNNFNSYVYSIDIIEKKNVRKNVNSRFITVRILSLYYIFINDRQFSVLAFNSNNMTGNFESNFCHFLESRLMFYVYRAGFFYNVFCAMRFLSEIGFIINNRIITSFRYLVPITTWVFSDLLLYFSRYFNNSANSNMFNFSIPRYIFVSYRFCYSFMWSKPSLRDLSFPITLDIFSLTGFY